MLPRGYRIDIVPRQEVDEEWREEGHGFTSGGDGVSLLEASKSLAFLSSSYSKEVREDLDGSSVNEMMGGIRRHVEET